MEPSIETVDIVLPLEKSEDDAARREAAAIKLGIPVSRIGGVKLRKHSIDARQRAVKVQLRLDVALDQFAGLGIDRRLAGEVQEVAGPDAVRVRTDGRGAIRGVRVLSQGLTMGRGCGKVVYCRTVSLSAW